MTDPAPLRVLSLFSGVGGFDLGLERAGMVTVFQCEIDKHCQQVLEHHWADVPRWDDVTTLTGEYVLEKTGGVDVVAWGSPCQDLSVAGRRAGLGGERSGLFHQGVRIINELRELSNGRYPAWSIWENVSGALSSTGGTDFGQVLYEMDEIGACFSEWRVLDAQYFGVPQRRRRVFVVSRFHPAGQCDSGCEVPVIASRSSGHPSASQQTRQDPAGEVADCTRDVGSAGNPLGLDDARQIVGALQARDWKGVGNQYVAEGKLIVSNTADTFSNSGFEKWAQDDVAVTLSARDHKGSNTLAVANDVVCEK